MAFNFIPKSAKEIGEAKFTYGVELIAAYNLVQKRNSKANQPFALDKSVQSKVKVQRALKENIEIADLKAVAPHFTFSWGNGSRGGVGAANKGIGFEADLVEDFQKYLDGEDSYSQFKNGNFIETFMSKYADKWDDFEVKAMGELNQKRPMVFVGDQPLISPATMGNYNIGATVTDLTIKPKGKRASSFKDLYLSAKYGSTVTFFGIGIRTILTPAEIDAGMINNANGKSLLKMLGIDNMKFCQVFKQYGTTVQPPEEIDVTSTCQKDKLTNFLKSGIGSGYILVHKLNGKVHHFEMTLDKLSTACTIQSVKVRYPYGTAKRVDIFVETNLLSLKMNIRSKAGDLYPTHIMADYTMKH